MENLENNLFEACKISLDKIQNYENSAELISKKSEIIHLLEQVSRLEFLKENETTLTFIKPLQNTDIQLIDDDLVVENLTENEVISDISSEQNDGFPVIESLEVLNEENSSKNNENSTEILENIPVEFFFKDETENASQSIDNEVLNSENIVENETVFNHSEDVLVNDENISSPIEKSELQDSENQDKSNKFKLANIKGISKVQSLFDVEEIPPVSDSGSLLKTNVPTSYMEAEKPKPEFRLDLNDRIAFSQHLFGGSQVELNETIAQLNNFKNLDEAKEFLSDIYYERNWSKSEDYAQRLWALVENKFL